jgi:hypothetical protein
VSKSAIPVQQNNAFWRSDNRASDFRMELRLIIGCKIGGNPLPEIRS